MPKKVFTLNDFSGGLVTDKSPRILEDNDLNIDGEVGLVPSNIVKVSKEDSEKILFLLECMI